MTEQPVGPRCGNNPHARLTSGDRKVLDDFRARLALEAAAKPHIEAAAWVDGDPLMEVIAVTLWRHCARDDKDMPQQVCDDPRTIAAFAAAVARAQADDEPAAPSVSAVDQTTRDRIRRVLCDHDGKGYLWGTDMLEPDEYGEIADLVLAVLPPTASTAWQDQADLRAENARLLRLHREDGDALAEMRARIVEFERPAIEAKRNEIRSSYTELIAQAEQDRDHESKFDLQCRLREREEQWAREDAPADPSRLADEAQQPAVGARQPDTETPKRASRWGVCDGCGAAAGPDCDCPPDTDAAASSAVPGRSAATSTDEEQARG